MTDSLRNDLVRGWPVTRSVMYDQGPPVPLAYESEEGLQSFARQSRLAGRPYREVLRAFWQQRNYGWDMFAAPDKIEGTVEAWPLPAMDPHDAAVAVGSATSFAHVMGEYGDSYEDSVAPQVGDDLFLAAVRRTWSAQGEALPGKRPTESHDASVARAYVALGFLPPAALAVRILPRGGDLVPILEESVRAVTGPL